MAHLRKTNDKNVNQTQKQNLDNENNQDPNIENYDIKNKKQEKSPRYHSENLNQSPKINGPKSHISLQNYSHSDKRQKLPNSLKQSLRKRAQQHSSVRINKPTEQMSPLTKKILSKFKREQFPCEICLGLVHKQDLVRLCKCNHTYCHDCILNYVTYKINLYEEVICPEETCDQVMNQETQFFNNLPPMTKRNYLKIHNFYLTSNDPTLKLCPKADCEGIIKVIENEPRVCGLCKNEFCSQCNFEKHDGTCDQRQAQFLQRQFNYRQCSRCKMMVERVSGCNHMTCKCRNQFCYVCGRRWAGNSHYCVEEQGRRNVYVGIFQQGGCCQVCNCCNDTCNPVCVGIMRAPLRVFLTFCFIGLLIAVIIGSLTLYTFYLISSLFLGLFGYSIILIADFCHEGKILLALLFIVLFPLAMLVGLYRAFVELFIPLVSDQLLEMRDFVRNDFLCIWA